MAQINVTQFAKELGLPIELLIEQLQTAGVKRKLTDDSVLTEKDKTQLLDYLRQSHGAREAKNKITLTRKQTTEIKKSDSTGKARESAGELIQTGKDKASEAYGDARDRGQRVAARANEIIQEHPVAAVAGAVAAGCACSARRSLAST